MDSISTPPGRGTGGHICKRRIQPGEQTLPGAVLITVLLLSGLIFMGVPPASAASVVATISLPPGGATSFSNLMENPSTNFLYVGSYPPQVIYAINRSSYTWVSIPVSVTYGDMAVNPVTNKVYHAEQGAGSVTVIDGNTNAILSSVPVPGCPTGIAANENTNKIYVSSQCTGDNAYVIDGNTDTLLPGITLPLGGVAGPVVADPATNLIYARATWDTTVIDGSSDSVLTSLPSFLALAVNPVTKRIYGACSDGNFCILNQTTHANELSISLGSWPVLMAVNPSTNRVYVTLGADDTLLIFDGNTDMEISRVPVGDNPTGVSVNPDTNLVYVANSNDGTISVVQDVIPPVAGFSGTPTSGTAPLTVTFTDTSTNTPTSWNWSFGDGSLVNATEQNPVHTYAGAGTYTISLNATNEGGSNTKTRAGYITVNIPPPVTGFSGIPASGTVPLTVAFTDTSTNTPTSWNWSFGDGSTVNATDQNAVHTYAAEGTYTVSLNATNAAGSNTFMRAGYITVNPVPTTASPSYSSGTGSSSSSPSSGAGTATAAVPGASQGETVTLVFNQPTTSATPTAVQQVQVIPSEDIGPVEVQAVSVDPEESMKVHDREVIGYKRIELIGLKLGVIGHGRITFTVSNAWLTEHHVTPAEIVMERYHDNGWAEVSTRFDHEKGGVSYFIADTPGFSYFAVTVRPSTVTPITSLPTPSPGTAAPRSGVYETTLPVMKGTTMAPAVPSPSTESRLPVLALVGIVILGAGTIAALTIRRWWIHRQNPALFRKLD